jgi:hypothetical protein
MSKNNSDIRWNKNVTLPTRTKKLSQHVIKSDKSYPGRYQAVYGGDLGHDQVFRREETEEDVPEEFAERFSPQEAQTNIAEFFADLAAPSSLLFFYLNYDNPLNSESRRYVLVGTAQIDAVSTQLEWQGMDQARASRYGVLVWNRFITHGFGEGRGCRIPYDRYLKAGADFRSVLLEIPDDMSRHFKYVCRAFTDDEANYSPSNSC